MYHKTISLLILSISLTTVGQSPTDYYQSAQGKTGYDLKTALHHIIKDHTVQSYASIWNHFKTTDEKPTGKVWDIYTDNPGGTPLYQFTFTSQQCGNYLKEGDCYNREHSWPKSWFNDASPMYTDLFHIFPTDGFVNGKRDNYPFGEVNMPSYTSSNTSKLGNNSTTGYSGVVFEPIDEYKGDLARVYFYMATRYEDIISGWEKYSTQGDIVLNGSDNQVFELWYLNLLFKWHHNDPVSTKEIDRNNAIYAIQGNRNPFIDHPEFAEKIWGILSKIHDSSNESLMEIISYNINNKNKIEWFNSINNSHVSTLSLIDCFGRTIWHYIPTPSENEISLDSAIKPGIYLIKATLSTHQVIIKKTIIK
jgi:endonuclease I